MNKRDRKRVSKVVSALLGEELPEWKRVYLIMRWLGGARYPNHFSDKEWRAIDWSRVNEKFDERDFRGAKRLTLKLAGRHLKAGDSFHAPSLLRGYMGTHKGDERFLSTVFNFENYRWRTVK